MNHNLKTVTFLLADDHSLIRQGIRFVLEEIDVNHVVYQATNLQQTLEHIKNHPIDIAIIDAHFPDGNSLAIISKVRKLRPEIKILIFSGLDESVQALKFINAGANGFLSKLSEEEEIKEAVLRIIATGEYLSVATQTLLLHSIRDPKAANPLSKLSERELEIAALYAQGVGNLEIANLLDIKQNTVSTLKKRIFNKLKIENIVELIGLMNDQ